MRLEGTLDAFSLPDIFQLLSYTKKTGALHLRSDAAHGVVHLRDGAVTGARSDIGRQALGRRLVGAGLVDDSLLATACEKIADAPGQGLAAALAELGELDQATVTALAAEQATDAVFDLLRWNEGEFAFVVDETDPDDLGAALPVEDLVTEARRRLEDWAALTARVPAPDAVVSIVPSPPEAPSLSVEEWALLALVDGRRTVADLVAVCGRGDYAVVGALGGLVGRGLVSVRTPRPEDDGTSAVVRRQQLLAALEGRPLPVEPVPTSAVPSQPGSPTDHSAPTDQGAPTDHSASTDHSAPQAGSSSSDGTASAYTGSVNLGSPIPERPEPFTPTRRPDHTEDAPSYARASLSPTTPRLSGGSVGAVHGATAMQPDHVVEATPLVERDPSVNKSLLLRLIAGVRGL